MLKLSGQDVANSPNPQVCIERRKGVNDSAKVAQVHVTLAPELFVSLLFFFPLIYRLLPMISPLHIFSLEPCIRFMSQWHWNPYLTGKLKLRNIHKHNKTHPAEQVKEAELKL